MTAGVEGPEGREPSLAPTPRASLPWFQRIGFRLFLALSGLSMVAYFGFPQVHKLSLRLLGLPSVDRGLVRVEPLPRPPADTAELALADLRPRGDLEYIAQALLTGSSEDVRGRRAPDPERQRALEAALALRGQGFLWLDTDQRLVCASSDLTGLEVGEPAPFALDELGEPKLFGDGEIGLGRVPVPVWYEGAHAGWLVLVPRATKFPAGAEPTYLTAQEYDRTVTWSARVINLFSLGFIAALALALSWALSRVVTRRVTDLAEHAAAPPAGDEPLPGPFDEHGDDEIARLAGSMNAMRARVLQLLEDLRQSDLERRRWIAQVSHDLRTPLTALIASLERAEGDLRGQRLGGLAEKLDDARLDAERLRELTEDLLDVARLDADDRLVREPVPPGELVRQAARELKPLAERAGIGIEVELAPKLPELAADGRRLMRALENLLRNALHHARSRILIRAATADDRIRFTVLDDGPGLPIEPGEDVWEVLSQRLSRPDSSGLGLVVVRRVAELHGGATGAENRPEGGACVWIEVPTA